MNEQHTVLHPFHGRGIVSTVSPCGQYAVVRYLSGRGEYRRTHRVSDLIRVTTPGSSEGASDE